MGENVDRHKLVAFDFAASGVRAMAAEMQENGALKIFSEELRKVEGIKNGIIGQPSGTAFNVVALLKELQNSAGIRENITKFSASFGGKSMKIVRATVQRKLGKSKEITAEIIDSMCAECEQSFQTPGMVVYDTIPVMYVVDGIEMEQPEGQKAGLIVGSYHLVVGNEQMKVQFQKCMERIYNCRIEHMPLAAEAFSVAVTEEEERRNGCAVINLGASSTTLAIYKDEVLQHLLVVPLGGQTISHDIEEIGISEAYAERLKCKKGVALESLVDTPVNIRIPARTPGNEPVTVTNLFVAMIIESRLDEIFEPIGAVLDRWAHKLPAGIVLTGGASRLARLADYVQHKTKLVTRVGDHSGWLTPDTDAKFYDPTYAQLIGTALLTCEYREENSREMPCEETDHPHKTSKRKSIGDSIIQSFFTFFEEDTDISGAPKNTK